MLQLDNQIGRANSLRVARPDVIKRFADEGIVDVVAGKHGGVIAEAVVHTPRHAVFANRIDTWRLVLVGIGIERRLASRPTVKDRFESG